MIAEWFLGLPPVFQAFLGGSFAWLITSLGAAFVFTSKKLNKKLLDFMLGAAAGIMLAASYWSLLAPAIELSSEVSTLPTWVPPALGFLLGGFGMRLLGRVLPHFELFRKREGGEKEKLSWHRSILLILAITLHNIPEGFAIGVAFGGAALGIPSATLAGAIALTLGIGIQDFPEGLAVSMPLRREGLSRKKSFFYGQLSGVVEPLAAMLGAFLVLIIRPILPYALSFAAGAMIFVVAEDLIPESREGENADLAMVGLILGFTLMMILDVALG